MSLVRASDRLELPETLQNQLYDFRKLVWSIKMIEAVCGAAAGVLVAFLALFVLDRLGETPGWARLSLFGLAVVSCACIPLAAHRWIWRNRRLEQLARLLTRKQPLVGDQLLGIIELVRNDFEQARSPSHCASPPSGRLPKTRRNATSAIRCPIRGTVYGSRSLDSVPRRSSF